ncbi:PBP1A family penicillin-binding protein [Bacillus sp. FSL W7-1360]
MSDRFKSRQERKQAQRKKGASSKKPRSLFKKILLTMAILFGIGVVGGGTTIAIMIATAPDLDPEKLTLIQSMQIYDMNDELVSTLDASEFRVSANIQDMPDHLKNAFIAVEDQRFYDHFGIDLKRLGGAIWANVTGGFGAEGASTITQQLVKNLFLTNEKALTRKVQEQYLAIQLERKYSKEEILEMYLNQINLGPSAGYGVQIAAETYFNKSLGELSVADAAVLAAIPRRPTFYDPHRNPENAEGRRNTIIGLMEEQGFITKEEADEARNTPIAEQMDYTTKERYAYSTFYDEVLDELQDNEELASNNLLNSGLKVYTTLDPKAQESVDRVLKSGEYQGLVFPQDNEDFKVGVTLVDTKSGAVRAFGNDIKENNQRDWNHATDPKQQGSAMKPLLAYAPGIEMNKWSTAKVLVDEKHNYTDGTRISNANNSYLGAMTMREALVRSRNIPAVKAMQEVSKDEAYAFLDPMIKIPETTKDKDGKVTHHRVEAGVLGGTQVSTKQMAGAYAAFGNGGTFTEPYIIRKVVFPDGREMNMEPESEKVMEDYTAYMVTDMLKDVINNPIGTGKAAKVAGIPVAGKTGTTNFNDKVRAHYNITDPNVYPASTFSGYSTNYTASVWMGFSKNGENNYLTDAHKTTAQSIFKHIMTEVHKGVDTPDFVKPDSVVVRNVKTPSDQISRELFVRGTEPEEIPEDTGISDPSKLSHVYDEPTNTLTFSWDYPEDEREEVNFEASIDKGSLQVNQNEMKAVFTNVTPGETYTFTVKAVSANEESKAVTLKVTPGAANDEDEEENEEEPPEPTPPGDDDNGESPPPSNGRPPEEEAPPSNENPGDGDDTTSPPDNSGGGDTETPVEPDPPDEE